MSIIWTEKYRPSDFSEVKGQKDIVSRVKAFVEKKNMPHLLFAGPAGVGKSTLAIIIAKKLFGESWKNNFLELNSSDERGIDTVRVKVKDFARTRAIGNVPFKIIFLDECDALTKEAQQALRRTMENYTQTTRFILSCNYSSRVIDPIQSRCTLFKFKPLPDEEMNKVIDVVCEKENLNVDETAKKALCEVSNGDCRRMENVLQACAALGNTITQESIFQMASVAKPEEVLQALNLAAKNQFMEAKKLLHKTMLTYGLSGLDVIKQIQAQAWKTDLQDDKKLSLVKYCGEVEFRMVEGSDDFIQLESLLAYISMLK